MFQFPSTLFHFVPLCSSFFYFFQKRNIAVSFLFYCFFLPFFYLWKIEGVEWNSFKIAISNCYFLLLFLLFKNKQNWNKMEGNSITVKKIIIKFVWETKGQIISKANYLFLNSSKKQTKHLLNSALPNRAEYFCLFFGRIENK